MMDSFFFKVSRVVGGARCSSSLRGLLLYWDEICVLVCWCVCVIDDGSNRAARLAKWRNGTWFTIVRSGRFCCCCCWLIAYRYECCCCCWSNANAVSNASGSPPGFCVIWVCFCVCVCVCVSLCCWPMVFGLWSVALQAKLCCFVGLWICGSVTVAAAATISLSWVNVSVCLCVSYRRRGIAHTFAL